MCFHLPWSHCESSQSSSLRELSRISSPPPSPMYRHKINTFCSDPSINIFEFKLKSFSGGDTIEMSIFQTADFMITILPKGEFKVAAQCFDLEGQWEDNVNAFLIESQTKDIAELLEYASSEFANLPDLVGDDLLSPTSAAATEDLLSPTSAHHTDEYLTDEEDISLNPDDLMDSVIDKESTLMKEKQKKVLAAAQDRKMKEVQAKGHLNDIVDQAKALGLETRDATSGKSKLKSDPNVKQLYVIFYFDGFTIGNTDSPDEKLELRKMDDVRQKPILKSLQAGYVPREFSGVAKEVDVHMIYKQCNYEDRFKKEEELKKSQEEFAKQQQNQNKHSDEELVKIEGLGEFTQEELDEQRRLLEEFQKSSNKEENKDESNKQQDDKKEDTTTSKSTSLTTSSTTTHTKKEDTTTKQSPTTTASSGKRLGEKESLSFVKDKDFTHTVDENKKTTTLQFLMTQDSSATRRERARFNVDSTIHALYQYVAHQFAIDNFILTFSGKPLKDQDKKLGELQITNATIRVVQL
mmetsp:Transcript_5264/g.19700  ORF Transcript_5264/g.19700 Transcript_5264/m.19700 type:complete len:523 (+) Transcript_5264:33-1601(+)